MCDIRITLFACRLFHMTAYWELLLVLENLFSGSTCLSPFTVRSCCDQASRSECLSTLLQRYPSALNPRSLWPDCNRSHVEISACHRNLCNGLTDADH